MHQISFYVQIWCMCCDIWWCYGNVNLSEGLAKESVASFIVQLLRDEFPRIKIEYIVVGNNPITDEPIFFIADMTHFVKKLANTLEFSSLKNLSRIWCLVDAHSTQKWFRISGAWPEKSVLIGWWTPCSLKNISTKMPSWGWLSCILFSLCRLVLWWW